MYFAMRGATAPQDASMNRRGCFLSQQEKTQSWSLQEAGHSKSSQPVLDYIKSTDSKYETMPLFT